MKNKTYKGTYYIKSQKTIIFKMKMKVSFTFRDGLPNLTIEEKNSEQSLSLSRKLKERPIRISCVPVIGMKIIINSFYYSYKLKNEEQLMWDKSFDADENVSFDIYSIGIHKKHLELFLK